MLNKEQLRIALRLKARAEKLIAGAAERLVALQAEEDEDAELTGRQARDMKIEPIVEIPFPLLDAILTEIVAVPEDAAVAETVQSYRKSVKFFRGIGTTNVIGWQLLKVIEAAGIAEPVAVAPPAKSAGKPPAPSEEKGA